MGDVGRDWDEREWRVAGRLGREGIGIKGWERMEAMEMDKKGWQGMGRNEKKYKGRKGVGRDRVIRYQKEWENMKRGGKRWERDGKELDR